MVVQARRHGWEALLPEALHQRGLTARSQGRLEAAEADLREAEVLSRAAEAPDLRARVLHGLGLVRRSRGQVREAREHLEAARTLAEEHALAHELCATCLALGGVAIQLGERARAEVELSRVLELAEATGRRVDKAMALNGLAELDRKEGRLAQAAPRYREALELFEAAGMTQAVFPRLNLGLVHLAGEEWAAATEVLRPALAELERQGRAGLAGATHAMLLAPALAEGRYEDAAHHLQETQERLARTGFAEPDLLWSLEQARDQAAHRGHRGMDEAIATLVASQRARLAQR